jgi:hypothetical protein
MKELFYPLAYFSLATAAANHPNPGYEVIKAEGYHKYTIASTVHNNFEDGSGLISYENGTERHFDYTYTPPTCIYRIGEIMP